MIPDFADTIYALAASGDTLYAGRASGLYSSDDGGASWHNTFDSLKRSDPLAVTAVAAEGNTVFTGVNGAVLRSEDGGASWQIIGLSSPAPQVTALVISPNFADDSIVIAGTSEDGVFVSNDRGASWTPWNFGLIDYNVYALAIPPDLERNRTVFAGTVSGIFRSVNGGRSWHELPFPMEAAPVLTLAISRSNLIYVGTEAHGLFLSEDGGENWQQVDQFAASGVNAIQIAPSQTWLLVEDRLYSSPDGLSWQPHAPIPASKLGIAMLPHPSASGTVIVGCADEELLRIS